MLPRPRRALVMLVHGGTRRAELSLPWHGMGGSKDPPRRGSAFGSLCAVAVSARTAHSVAHRGAFRRYSLQTTICGLYNEHIAISLRAKILDMSGQTSHAQLARTARTHGSHGFVLVAQALPGVRRGVHHFPDEHKQGRSLHLRRVPVRAPAHNPAGVPPTTVASAQTARMRRPDETAIADAARARTGGADIRAEGSREGRRGEQAQGG